MQVLNAGSRYFNRYLLVLSDGYCLIDTGYKWEYPKFCEKLQKLGVRKEEIKYVVLTHAHSDHVGFLKEMLADISPKVIFHPAQKARLEAGKNNIDVYVSNFPSLIGTWGSLTFVDKTQCFPAIKTESFIPYEQNPLTEYGIEFIPLAGHTDADLAIKVGSMLFCGDICMNAFPASAHFPLWLENKYVLLENWEKILSLPDVATVYPSHGKPFDVKELRKDIEVWRTKGVFKLFKKKKNQI